MGRKSGLSHSGIHPTVTNEGCQRQARSLSYALSICRMKHQDRIRLGSIMIKPAQEGWFR